MTELLQISARVRFRQLGDEGVAVNVDTGRVIVVNTLGAWVMRCLDEPVTRPQLVERIVEQFEVSGDQARRDLDAFLDGLDGEELVEKVLQ